MLDSVDFFRNSRDIGIMTDAEGFILALSAGAERALGKSEADLVGSHVMAHAEGSQLQFLFGKPERVDTCTHVGGPLSEGEVEGTSVRCPWHGAVFDLTTGDMQGPPARGPVTRYEVRVEGDGIELATG